MLLKRLLNFGGKKPNMEFEDKNVKIAVQKAAKALKISEKDLQYEVITYGSTGIFGLVGAKKAKIKAILPKEPVATENNQISNKDSVLPVKTAVSEGEEDVSVSAPREKDIASRKDAIEAGRLVLQKILDKIADDATAEIEETGEAVLYNVKGGNAAVLIGKRGQTLEAIQYIVERTVNKNSEKRIRLQIDVAGYLENRKVNLEQRAQRLAEKVKRIGKPVTVGEMNVYDRKIVHLTLKENKFVRTQSMGNGFYRKLVIFPSKGGSRTREKKE
jgi:spoIIIJ-associated protein